ncbi:MAG: PaaI family thioesterase [Hyphomonadaceae bacterium]
MSDDVEARNPDVVPDGYEAMPWRRGFGRQVGPFYWRVRDGSVTMGFRVEDHHTNGMNNAHGGMLMTFADMAWGRIVSIERSSFWVTVRITCDFLSSARLGDWVEASSEVMHEEDGLYTVRGRVWTGERVLMTGTGLFKAMDPRPPRPGEKAYHADG